MKKENIFDFEPFKFSGYEKKKFILNNIKKLTKYHYKRSHEYKKILKFIDFKINTSSIGFIVWMLMISAEIPISLNFWPAKIDSQTKWPVATIVTSFPSFNTIPLPISNFWFRSVKFGTLGLPNLR